MKNKEVNKNLKNNVRKRTSKNMNQKRSGFTLIELLAVIVILGLLLAIAIPSITKYITQSRKKTVVSSIDGYISSILESVNDQDYKFTTPNTIYAVPIECVSLEKGGVNPLGEWLQANDDYWAYVLVQYDSASFSYNYGFTFKDSNGYGMYPTGQDKIDMKNDSQIKIGLNLKRPKSGLYTNIADADKWSGFKLDSNTMVVVLESTESNADGIYTCPLNQKGSNYGDEKEDVVVNSITLKYREFVFEIKYEEGMTWGEWVDSEYNTFDEFYSYGIEIRVNINDSLQKKVFYNCPIVTDLNQSDFSLVPINSSELILSENPYYFDSVATGPIDLFEESVDEFESYIFKSNDGTFKYVKN